MTRLSALLVALTLCGTLVSQSLPEPYQLAPDYMHAMLSDVIASDCQVVAYSSGGGQYFGHSRRNRFFGWGSYIAGSNCWIGQWRDGHCVFGILIKGAEGRVGSDTHHIVYNLTDGTPLRIVKDNETRTFTPEASQASPRRFVRLDYANGDYYIGETMDNRCHGQGIYHWSNGNYWYGTFSEGYRQGFGALFRTDGTIDHGLWLGDDKQ